MSKLSPNMAKMVPRLVPKASRATKINQKITVRDQKRFPPEHSQHFDENGLHKGAQGGPQVEPTSGKNVKNKH